MDHVEALAKAVAVVIITARVVLEEEGKGRAFERVRVAEREFRYPDGPRQGSGAAQNVIDGWSWIDLQSI